jgi:riboflavin kinase/FMN adenylyltransferase
MRYSGKVLKGTQEGRKIGFPTANFSSSLITAPLSEGVYSATVFYESKTYQGALYYGPRLVKNEKNTVLEIHILDFHKTMYGQTVEFEIGSFIRGVMDFSSFSQLQEQIQKDIQSIRALAV